MGLAMLGNGDRETPRAGRWQFIAHWGGHRIEWHTRRGSVRFIDLYSGAIREVDVERKMKLTKLQERALSCLYRRATWRSKGRVTEVALSAGKGAQPDGEPYDLLRWDRMEAFEKYGLIRLMPDAWTQKGHVRLTPAGCLEVERRMGNG